jgi:hypothetical protein
MVLALEVGAVGAAIAVKLFVLSTRRSEFSFSFEFVHPTEKRSERDRKQDRERIRRGKDGKGSGEARREQFPTSLAAC